jgi:hypothetical protein
MSGIKREIERRDELDAVANHLLLQHGAIVECEIHSGIYLDEMDGDAVDAAINDGVQMVESGSVKGSASEIEDAIRQAVGEASMDGCPLCDKAMAD